MMTHTVARRLRVPGFTLIEVVVAMAIVAILAAVAVPTYRSAIRKGERANARAIMMENAQFMERYHAAADTYVGATLPTTVSPKGALLTKIKYNITLTPDPTATTFTISAAPANSQIGDSCGTMTISSTGATTAATSTGCW